MEQGRSRVSLLLVLRAVVVCLLAAIAVPIVAAPGQTAAPAPTLESLLTRYDRGEFDAVVAEFDRLPVVPPTPARRQEDVPLDPLFVEWMALGPRWIAAGPDDGTPRRRFVAAAFALEVARARTSVDWVFRYPFLAWACEVLRSVPGRPAGHRWWYLASIGVLQDNDDWAHVMGGQWTPLRARIFLRRTPMHFIGRADQEEALAGHLSHAKAVFPEELRWLLTEVQSEESQKLFEPTMGPVGIGGHVLSKADLDEITGALKGERAGRLKGSVDLLGAKAALHRASQVPAIAARYEALNVHPALRGDVALHLGFLHLRREEWEPALKRLADVPELAAEPAIVAMSYHLTGWIHQQAGRRDEAIAAYRRALALAPRSRSTAILLASQLGSGGATADGYAVLFDALEARPAPGVFPPATAAAQAPLDLWPLYPRGDALLVPTYIARMREALR